MSEVKKLSVIKVSTPDGKNFFKEYDPNNGVNMNELGEKTRKYLDENNVPLTERGKTVFSDIEMTEDEYRKIPASSDFWG